MKTEEKKKKLIEIKYSLFKWLGKRAEQNNRSMNAEIQHILETSKKRKNV
jgi:hypothetical protein